MNDMNNGSDDDMNKNNDQGNRGGGTGRNDQTGTTVPTGSEEDMNDEE